MEADARHQDNVPAAHSPTPWVVNGRGSAGWRIDAPGAERTGLDFLRHPVAVVPLEADAALIELAVNCHDDLLAVAWLAVRYIEAMPLPVLDQATRDAAARDLEHARVAIAAATGQAVPS